IRGALLALPGAVASHHSAAHLLDFPRLPKLKPTVLVASHTTHKFTGVTVRRCEDLDRSHLTIVERVRVTNVVRTAFDLAGALEFNEFDAMAEALILAGRMELRHLERMTNQLARRGKPGSRSARDFIAIRSGTDSRATILERKGHAALVAAGLPSPIAQFPIPWDPGRRFDDAYPDAMLAIEWDSRAWHEQRAAMRADRKRDREAALHGWFVARFTWQDVTENPADVGATVAALLNDRRAAS
ncbi:MAG: endonuclease domain-containing protein, partial [Acidimicrobiia bacterium]